MPDGPVRRDDGSDVRHRRVHRRDAGRPSAENEPRRAVRDVVERAVAAPTAVGDALQPDRGRVHHAPPRPTSSPCCTSCGRRGCELFPHDHRMWAVIGIYAGQEDNAFYRRAGPGSRVPHRVGRQGARARRHVLLGDDTIHGVTNPLDRLTGGDPRLRRRLRQPAAQPVGPRPREERPYDIDERPRASSPRPTRRGKRPRPRSQPPSHAAQAR